MKHSTERIPTTHTGSLPRPPALLAALRSNPPRTPPDEARFQDEVRAAVSEVVRKQRQIGIDVVNDGEQGRRHYSTYIADRLSGFEGAPLPYNLPRDQREFPEFEAWLRSRGVNRPGGPTCTGPVEWKDFAAVQRDIERIKTAAGGTDDVFMSAVSPGQAARIMQNRYYRDEDTYLQALGRALRREYQAIADAGLILQIDCPDLASGWNNLPDALSVADFRKMAQRNVEVLNDALRDIPAERMRLHLCWGNYEGPHNHDIALEDILDCVFRAKPMAISLEGANPRHGHEWRVFQDIKLPQGKLLIPGVIDSTTNFIEHPRLVAERIGNYARVVGRENVIAGTDCGFASTGSSTVLPGIAWAKLQSLVEGARLASAMLW